MKLVYLRGDFTLIADQLRHRRGHFMNPALLRSQFADLEEPQPAEACFGPANWYATVTPLAEVTDVEDEVNFQTRMIVGLEF